MRNRRLYAYFAKFDNRLLLIIRLDALLSAFRNKFLEIAYFAAITPSPVDRVKYTLINRLPPL